MKALAIFFDMRYQ